MNKNQEQKRERFRRLGTQRTNTVLQRLKVLGNCSNRSAYDYTEEEINKIFSEIERRVRETKAKFHFPKNKEFKLLGLPFFNEGKLNKVLREKFEEVFENKLLD